MRDNHTNTSRYVIELTLLKLDKEKVDREGR